MEKKYDVIALGELLIDFAQSGQSEQGNRLFEACPGGAPCNVLALLSKMGKKTAFLGKVGQDQFGVMLKQAITEEGIDASHLMMDESVPTTLAFIHSLEGGERDFSFYRSPGADMMLTEDEVTEEFLPQAKIFHFGSLSMTDEGVRRATRKAIRIAEENGLLRSFDPNLRPPLWKTQEEAREQIKYGLAHCDILKISDNEVQFVSQREDYEEGIRYIQEQYHIPLILFTMGKEGSRAYYNGICVEVKGKKVQTIETTGAGDTFCGASLSYLLDHDLSRLTEEELKEMLEFANAAAAIVTTRKGALKAMPKREEILSLLKQDKE